MQLFCKSADVQLIHVPKKKKAKTVEIEDQEWVERYGEKAQKIIRACVDANIPDYEHLKSFAIKL